MTFPPRPEEDSSTFLDLTLPWLRVNQHSEPGGLFLHTGDQSTWGRSRQSVQRHRVGACACAKLSSGAPPCPGLVPVPVALGMLGLDGP